MKLLWALSFSLFASAAMACTDFTGTYKDETASTYTVQQTGCATVVVNSSDGTETIIADGQYRVTSEDDQVRVVSAANFIGNNLTIDGRIEYKTPFPPDMPTNMVPTRVISIYTLDSAGNLVMNLTVYNSSNQVIGQSTTTHQRI